MTRRYARLIAVAMLVGLILVCLIPPALAVVAPARLADYVYRELAYRVISDRVTAGAESEMEKADALLNYMSTHEYAPTVHAGGYAPGMESRPVDATVMNDLVRGIGWCDQQAWGLATLLAKQEIPGTLLMLRGNTPVSHHSVAEVYLSGEWRILDPFYAVTFVRPNGDLATFDDLQHPEQLASDRRGAIEAYQPDFFDDYYFSMFAPDHPPTRWAPLTSSKDVTRRIITRGVDLYEGVFGRAFAHPFQDAWLLRQRYDTEDAKLFFRARHYHLFFRQERALALYARLTTEYPNSSYVEDALYFEAHLRLGMGQWAEAARTFEALLSSRFGATTKWGGARATTLGIRGRAFGTNR